MQRSAGRILTTHTGSLPRPHDLTRLMFDILDGADTDDAAIEARVRDAVLDVVARQREIGVDVVSDGEMGKVGFANYAVQRYSGIGREPEPVALHFADLAEVPAATQLALVGEGVARMEPPLVRGPLRLRDHGNLRREFDDLLAGLAAVGDGVGADGAFVSAVSPGQFVYYFPNRYYRDDDEYLQAVIPLLAAEYRTIIDSGLNLQLDSPEAAMAGHFWNDGREAPDMVCLLERSIDALNAALSGLPAERIRLHVCWGNYGGPHHKDVELRRFVEPILRARVGFLSVEAANPPHEHEWRVWQEFALPDDKALIPGVIDTNTIRVEHPLLVADRVERFAALVGRERVIAGTDCGFETFVGVYSCPPQVAWLKLQSLVEGARIATSRLW